MMGKPQGAAPVKETGGKRLFAGAPGPGRPKGIPNKATTEFRETITRLLEDNSQNIGIWLTKVAGEDPGKALDLVAKLAEFAAPKLSRSELAGDPSAPLQTVQRIELVPLDGNSKD